MSRQSMVPWRDSLPIGPMAGSRWACPGIGVEKVAKFEREGGIVTDEVILAESNGHWQDFVLRVFPGGLHAVDIVRVTDNKVLTEPAAANMYAGLKPTPTGAPHAAQLLPRLHAGGLSVGDEREVTAVKIDSSGTTTTIKPTPVQEGSSDYEDRKAASLLITPASRSLKMYASGMVRRADDIHAAVSLNETGGRPSGFITVKAGKNHDKPGSVAINIGPDGQLTTLKVTGQGLLAHMAVKLSSVKVLETEAVAVADARERAKVLYFLRDIVPFNGLGALDLRTSVSALYRHLGDRDMDPLSHLAYQKQPVSR